ncbi:ABC transporter permease [Halococcoides cellulosivorans]|uniref:Iron ABC transporter permease n=1 Tax=Halococcoides cellulosivorans TaxID=1679096 RepID=A0A2R4WY71_9EURY|nr:iron ABC transporter permease [Halococcoides cellulosivorans]AWB26482.1 iron ABC transporter permease [Halococcoides cellulosivorans]
MLSNVDDRPVGLTLLSGAIAALLILPLTWLVVEATTVEPARAIDLIWSVKTLQITLASLALMGGVTAASIALGVPLAYLTVRTDLPGRQFWTVAVALPLVVPSYVGAFAFVSAFGPRGEFHDFLAPLGIERLPEIYGLPGAIAVVTLYTYPYVYLTTRAGLIAFDSRQLEAARTLDSGRLAAIRRVVLPQIRPSIAAGALLAALYAISDFGTPAIMRANVFTRRIYVEYHAYGSEYAALLSLQLLAIVLVVLALEHRIRPDRDVTSGDRSASPVALGRWRWPATLFPATIALLALAVPIWILLGWLVRADSGGAAMAFEWLQVFNSVGIATAAAAVAVLAALPVAYLAARSDDRLAAVFERATYVGFAVPGIVLALAVVSFGSSAVPWIYPSLVLLVFAYVVRFLPQAVGAVRSSILQIDPRLLEAGRTLGDSPTRAVRRITIPLARSGIVAGAALVFLTTMKELPVTLVLRPTGFETIVTQIWRAQETAFYQYAAVPALLLIGISGLSMLVLLAQDGTDGL